jgi:LmbE family N-acetylglucosaminyl deacetylase
MAPPRDTGRTLTSRNSSGLGRAELAWLNWPGFNTLAVIAPEILVPRGYRAVIVAPRADEETLGLSGLISRLVTVSRPILLVAATDHRAGGLVRSRWPHQRATEWMPEPLRALRGFSGARSTILRSGLQEGELSTVEDDLEWRLRGLILPSDIVFASWRYDGHPDYEATGRVAARACAALFAPLVEVPVWAWLWSVPGDRRIPWLRARRIFLERAVLSRQRRALAEYRSRARHDAGASRTATVAARETRPHEIVLV